MVFLERVSYLEDTTTAYLFMKEDICCFATEEEATFYLNKLNQTESNDIVFYQLRPHEHHSI